MQSKLLQALVQQLQSNTKRNQMKTKVYGGQPTSGRSLCYHCRYCLFIRGSNLQEDIHCHRLERDINYSVVECSSYDPKHNPALEQMQQIAWVVETRTRGPWGFKGEQDTKIVVRPPGEGDPTPTEVIEP